MTEIPTYRIYTAGGSGEAELLALQGLSQEKVATALELYAAIENAAVETVMGISIDGVIFTSVKNWTLSSADQFTDITIVPWQKIHELIDRN